MEQTDAIVLRVHPWSETSCVVALFTRDFGKVAALAKGARRPKSPFEAALDLLSACRVVFIPKSGDALDILTEAKLVRRFRTASRDLLRLYCGYYVAELLDKLTDRNDRLPELFDLADESISALENKDWEPRAIVLRFELQILRLTGHLPAWRQCSQCGRECVEEKTIVFGVLDGGVLCANCRPGARQTIRVSWDVLKWMETFSHQDWRSLDMSRYALQERRQIRTLLTRYITALLDRKLQLHGFLEELGR